MSRKGYVVGKGPKAHLPLEQRFWKKVDKSGGDDSCWNWTGATARGGHGKIGEGGKGGRTLTASRVSWEIHRGAITGGLHVLHHCDNPRCVNPKHLYLGTQKENSRDMVERNRFKNRATPKGSRNGRSFLVESEVAEIKLLATIGFSCERLGELYGVNGASIERIILGMSWADVEPMKPRFGRYRNLTWQEGMRP